MTSFTILDEPRSREAVARLKHAEWLRTRDAADRMQYDDSMFSNPEKVARWRELNGEAYRLAEDIEALGFVHLFDEG